MLGLMKGKKATTLQKTRSRATGARRRADALTKRMSTKQTSVAVAPPRPATPRLRLVMSFVLSACGPLSSPPLKKDPSRRESSAGEAHQDEAKLGPSLGRNLRRPYVRTADGAEWAATQRAGFNLPASDEPQGSTTEHMLSGDMRELPAGSTHIRGEG